MIELLFIGLAVANIAAIIQIIRWRRITSCEGVACTIMLIYFISFVGPVLMDRLGIGGDVSTARSSLETMRASLRPLSIHIIGLLSFAAGFALLPKTTLKTEFGMSKRIRKTFLCVGWLLIVAGFVMKVIALRIAGFSGIGSYLDDLYSYDISIRTYGFLDLGPSLVAFGGALAAVAKERSMRWQVAFVTIALSAVFLLSTSKAAFFYFAFPFFLLCRSYSPLSSKRWFSKKILIPTAAILLLLLGLKTQIKYRGIYGIDLSPTAIAGDAISVITTRASDRGLYMGYVNLVNRVSDNPALKLHGLVLRHVFLGAMPRFLYQKVFREDKPPHPFKGLGLLVNSDFIVNEESNDAPTFFGASYVDFGLTSMVIYSFIGALFLGYFRNWSARRVDGLRFIPYIYLAANFGPAMAESGLLNIVYESIQAAILLLVVTLVISCVAEDEQRTEVNTSKLNFTRAKRAHTSRNA